MTISTATIQGLEELSVAVGFRFACLDMKQRATDAVSRLNWDKLAKSASEEASTLAIYLLRNGVPSQVVRSTVLTGEVLVEAGVENA